LKNPKYQLKPKAEERQYSILGGVISVFRFWLLGLFCADFKAAIIVAVFSLAGANWSLLDTAKFF